ncbi:hypothetical protein IAI10_00135 [Clostridium sp. 19966]|uniref:SpaA isopeptide-forming pilin-related protein n=1 Tax=Clostridium sp. 19966 TaxID=2768166 RepID=UPI0028DF27F3|nr:SpaA isopeptide-forming pilin-related protein [Clostridium sp. 19966]MDT8715087.1 hypothetical protein [Clostridium sp. 19966]
MKKNKFLILPVVIIFILQIFMPSVNVKAAGNDVSGKFPFITDLNITDANGNKLGDNISKSAEIHINYTWSILNGQAVNNGDYFIMQLPDQINIFAAFDQPLINPDDGNTVANMHVDTNGKVTITFTDYASGHSDVHGGFALDCHFNKDNIGNANPIYITFTVPAMADFVEGPFNFQQPDPTVVKSGSYDPLTDEITWTITANKEGARLNNATIEDNISGNQAFVAGSVKINGDAGVSGTNYNYDSSSNKLVFNLGSITTQQVITFKTSVHDDLASKAQGTYYYNNNAVLKYEDNSNSKNVNSNTASVPVNVSYITKDGSYDSSTKSINWTITVNGSGRTINNASVTDNIPSGLTLDTSSIKINGISSSSYTSSGQAVTFNLGNITSKQTITYSTAVDTSIYNSNSPKSYSNTAYLLGDGVPNGTSANKNVGVNSNIIQKQGTGYDASTGIITWKITVNNNKTSVAAGAKVTDNIPIGQTYVIGSAKFDGSSIDDGGYTAANAGDTSKTGTFAYTFSSAFSDIHTIEFKTQVTDPKAYRANYSGSYNNTVNFTAVNINQNTSATQPVSSEIINKTGAGYDYAAREISWKIVVNKNKIPITNAVITDNIPVGQEYVYNSAAIDNTASNNGFSYTPVTGDASKTGTLIYTFPKGITNTIHDTYTITFKTKVTDLSIFNSNGSKILNNTASISGDEIPDDGNRSSIGTQNVDNTVINKVPTYKYGNAYIDWTLNINSNYSIPMAGATITDNLQDGLSLNTDTVELYKAAINSAGNLSATDKVTLTGENVKYDPSTREFDFTFPQDSGTSAYILKFTTDTTKSGNYLNVVQFKGQSSDQSAQGTQNNVWFSSGSGWGTGTSGSITVSKVDSNDNTKKLSGAVFQLIDQYGNVKATSSATGNDGQAVFKSLKYDTDYSLKEITPPTGYSLSSEVYKFQVHNVTGQQDITYVYKDTKIKKDIVFSKLGEDGKALPGAEFTLYEEDGNTSVKDAEGKDIIAVSDQQGKVTFKNIDYGNYKIKETKAPTGYLLSSNILNVVLSGDYQNAVVTVTPNSISNVLIRGGIKITKTDASTLEPVAGAEVAVYTGNGVQVGTAGVTGADGTVEFDNLPYGDYYYIETKAPEGYLLNTDKHPFSISENGFILQDTFSDTKITGGIKILKLDATSNKPVAGATVTVYTSTGQVVGKGVEGVTGADGTVEFDNLSYGDYYYMETEAPEGYLLNTDKHPFSIREDGVVLTDTFSDAKIKGTVEVRKNGEDGNYLGDTEFTLFDTNDNAVQSAVTDDTGLAKFLNIEYGKYYVKETRAPKGYTISDKKAAVEVNGIEDEKTYDAGTITDVKIRGAIQIKKLDQDGKPLKGAEFTLYDSEGKAIATAVSAEDGIVLFKDLVYGDYSVKETKVPEGYTASSDSINVSVETDGAVYSYEVKNTKIKSTVEIKETDNNGKIASTNIQSLPKTGRFIDATMSVLAGIISILAGIYLTINKKKTKRS